MEMMTNSTAETRDTMMATKGQPVSRLYFPPFMTTAKATRVPRQSTAATAAMNPTVFHMEQKYRWPSWQSSL